MTLKHHFFVRNITPTSMTEMLHLVPTGLYLHQAVYTFSNDIPSFPKHNLVLTLIIANLGAAWSSVANVGKMEEPW